MKFTIIRGIMKKSAINFKENQTMIKDAAKKMAERLSDQFSFLEGLTDKHIKFITYFLSHEMKVPHFDIEIKYLGQKEIILHVFDDQANEVFIKPKSGSSFDKFKQYLNLPAWDVKFASNKKMIKK